LTERAEWGIRTEKQKMSAAVETRLPQTNKVMPGKRHPDLYGVAFFIFVYLKSAIEAIPKPDLNKPELRLEPATKSPRNFSIFLWGRAFMARNLYN